MRNWLGLVIVSAVGVFGAAACSSTPADKYPSVDSYCAAKAEQECTVAARCAVTVEACKQKRIDLCNVAAGVAVGSARKYTSSRVDDCLDKTKKLYEGTAPITPAMMAVAQDACERVFVGSAANNTACKSSFDCASESSVCDKGLCGPKVSKNVNDGCANAGEVCGDSGYCGKVAPNVCLARPTTGQPCSADVPCAVGLRCDNTCQAAIATGGGCNVDADCAPGAPFCDTFNGKLCDAGIIFAPSAKSLCALYGGGG